jgi:hypothetical protein
MGGTLDRVGHARSGALNVQVWLGWDGLARRGGLGDFWARNWPRSARSARRGVAFIRHDKHVRPALVAYFKAAFQLNQLHRR